MHFCCRNVTNKRVFGDNFAILKVWSHLRKRWFRVDETQILEVGCGALCRLVAFSRALGFEEVSAMTFCKFYSIFCKVTPKVTLKVTLDSARQITFFITIVSPPISPPVSPTNFETISTPNLHFWRRNASNKPVFGAKLAILKVWCHSWKWWFRVDETPILEVGQGAPCIPVAFSVHFVSKRFLRWHFHTF